MINILLIAIVITRLKRALITKIVVVISVIIIGLRAKIGKGKNHTRDPKLISKH